ncbi:unnamed protein product [Didymodactylos carnosus]|uniref:Uncharacterized protein n=1 Tax=Didymodactylos carnosus TaxID=1234261 RepID=A0A813T9I7_9BILA|nr:unnamed protein product [Didymodactylos carnosus]CAF0807546.1 unnamed protein product [Didymodactylos carnosus]CAF3535459.1 unnamed protein product [Didymodactylos carnosus]CAF3593061.1 unnamed protein product [Didymodactylos carnosus]
MSSHSVRLYDESQCGDLSSITRAQNSRKQYNNFSTHRQKSAKRANNRGECNTNVGIILADAGSIATITDNDIERCSSIIAVSSMSEASTMSTIDELISEHNTKPHQQKTLSLTDKGVRRIQTTIIRNNDDSYHSNLTKVTMAKNDHLKKTSFTSNIKRMKLIDHVKIKKQTILPNVLTRYSCYLKSSSLQNVENTKKKRSDRSSIKTILPKNNNYQYDCHIQKKLESKTNNNDNNVITIDRRVVHALVEEFQDRFSESLNISIKQMTRHLLDNVASFYERYQNEFKQLAKTHRVKFLERFVHLAGKIKQRQQKTPVGINYNLRHIHCKTRQQPSSLSTKSAVLTESFLKNNRIKVSQNTNNFQQQLVKVNHNILPKPENIVSFKLYSQLASENSLTTLPERDQQKTASRSDLSISSENLRVNEPDKKTNQQSMIPLKGSRTKDSKESLNTTINFEKSTVQNDESLKQNSFTTQMNNLKIFDSLVNNQTMKNNVKHSFSHGKIAINSNEEEENPEFQLIDAFRFRNTLDLEDKFSNHQRFPYYK